MRELVNIIVGVIILLIMSITVSVIHEEYTESQPIQLITNKAISKTTSKTKVTEATESTEKELKSQTGVTLPKKNVGKVNTSIEQDTNDMLFTTKKVISSPPMQMIVLILLASLIKTCIDKYIEKRRKKKSSILEEMKNSEIKKYNKFNKILIKVLGELTTWNDINKKYELLISQNFHTESIQKVKKTVTETIIETVGNYEITNNMAKDIKTVLQKYEKFLDKELSYMNNAINKDIKDKENYTSGVCNKLSGFLDGLSNDSNTPLD